MVWNVRKIVSVDTKEQRSQNASLWHSTSHRKLGLCSIMNFNNLVARLKVAAKPFDSGG